MITQFVITYKASFMQRIQDYVRTGHIQYVTGQITKEKLANFLNRMDHDYSVFQSYMAASRRRKSGDASFRLLVASLNNNEVLTFFLLRTEGAITEKAKNEKWRNALKDKIIVTGYELVRRSRSGKKGYAWTWRYTKEQYNNLYDGVIEAIRRKSNKDLDFHIDMIKHTQGFSGAREQAKKLLCLIKAEWRAYRGKEVLPQLPSRIGYHRRVATLGRNVMDLDKKRPIRKNLLK